MGDQLERAKHEDGPSTVWTIKGKKGGIHVWHRRLTADTAIRFNTTHIGGVELHFAVVAPEWERDREYEKCWLIGCECRHVGHDVAYTEHIEPHLGNDAKIFEVLTDLYQGVIAA